MLMSSGDMFKKIGLKFVIIGAIGASAVTRLRSYRHCWRPGLSYVVGSLGVTDWTLISDKQFGLPVTCH
jgi:hypothetical protein